MDLTPEEREKIYQEEKARLEIREELARESGSTPPDERGTLKKSGPVLWTAGDASQAIGCVIAIPILIGIPVIWSLSPGYTFGFWAGAIWAVIWVVIGAAWMNSNTWNK